MGTPAFACPILEALLARPEPVVAVVCQPDRPRGRGLAVTAPETKRLAERHGIPVLQPARIRDPAFADALRTLAPDVVVVAAYGRILPRAILDLPAHGCLNVHASLLPRHRGAAPAQWAILEGDAESGVTIMQMNEEMDAGDVLLERPLALRPDHTAGSLLADLARLGATAIGEALDGLRDGHLAPRPQPVHGITFAPRIEGEAARIDWSRDAAALERQVRAMAPAPSAFTTLAGKRLAVHRAILEDQVAPAPPGTVLSADGEGIVVAAGHGALRLLEVQLEGRKRMGAAAFLQGARLSPGVCLGA